MQQVKTLFGLDADLIALSRHAESINIAQKIWVAVAPTLISQFSHATSLKNGQLNVAADNGAVATKIKLLNASLLTQLENLSQSNQFGRGSKVTAISVKVQAKSALIKRAKPQRKLSKRASASLESLTDNLVDSPLREALNRLAKRI
jgi:hypothetical protein